MQAKTRGANCRRLAPVAASSSPSAPLPRVQKKVNDFGLPEVALINAAIRKGWSDHNLVPSKAATDGEWCRRVYLDLIGRVPTVEELTAYLSDHKNDKRERLVDRLLGEEYSDEYTRNWTTIWTNILIGRTGGNERRSLVDRDGMQKYLTETLKYNKPYDEMAKELITATGSCRPGDEDFNGAANFLADKMAENGVQATAKTSQIFLGHGRAVHAVSQPSVQRVQAEPVLGDERVLPADAGRAA